MSTDYCYSCLVVNIVLLIYSSVIRLAGDLFFITQRSPGLKTTLTFVLNFLDNIAFFNAEETRPGSFSGR